MLFDFDVENHINPVASYGAILSTLLAIWELIKWCTKNSIRLTCKPNMIFIGAEDSRKYILTTVTNTGSSSTTITGHIGLCWKSNFDRVFHRNCEHYFINETELPKIIHPGEQWHGKACQEDMLKKLPSNGIFYIGVSHSMSKNPVLRRVKISIS